MKNLLWLTCGLTLGFVIGRDYGVKILHNIIHDSGKEKKEMKAS